MTKQEARKAAHVAQMPHKGTRTQLSSHGCGRWSVQLFDKRTGVLVADYDLSPSPQSINAAEVSR